MGPESGPEGARKQGHSGKSLGLRTKCLALSAARARWGGVEPEPTLLTPHFASGGGGGASPIT
jgi:hypothetical protein